MDDIAQMSDVTNEDRRSWALEALEAFTAVTGDRIENSEDLESVLTDLITDIMHLCDEEKIDFATISSRAAHHHECETD